MNRNVEICHHCEFMPKACNGPCPCLADPQRRNIFDLAAIYECPKHKFPARGAGDLVKHVLDVTGIGPVAKKCIEKVTGKPCGCADRQAKLNRLIPTPPKW